jgi:hypothetical protein
VSLSFSSFLFLFSEKHKSFLYVKSLLCHFPSLHWLSKIRFPLAFHQEPTISMLLSSSDLSHLTLTLTGIWWKHFSHLSSELAHSQFFFSVFFFFFGSIGILTQSLALARQALYYLSYTSSPICFSYFSNKVLLLQPDWPRQQSYLLFSVAGMTEMAPCLAIGWDGVSWNFSLGWPQTIIFLISACWVARITGMSHHTQGFFFFFNLLWLYST